MLRSDSIAPKMETEEASAWIAIKWKKAIKFVLKMQRRIVFAYKEGNTEKLNALNHLLINSFQAKALAVYLVTNSKGARTPGVDRVRWRTDEQKYNAVMDLIPERYQPQPYKLVYIPKDSGGFRKLNIPTMSDRAMQMLHKFALEPISECKADPYSYAYRHWRSAHGALAECRKLLKTGAMWVIEGDIKSCFDSISHDWLLKNVPLDNDILTKFLKCGCIEGSRYIPSCGTGISQGSPISPVLCNLTLDGMCETLKQQNNDLEIIRYADDFVVFSKNIKPLGDAITALNEFLEERGLSLSKEKTVISSVKKGFEFLGFFFQNKNGFATVEPSTKSVRKVLHAAKDKIIRYAEKEPTYLAEKLNPVLLGWANYHKYVSSRTAFTYVDAMITHYLSTYGISREVRSLITQISEVPVETYLGVPTEINPFEVHLNTLYEKWEYFWWY